MELGLNGRRVVVAGGIGREIALAFGAEGAAVSICARGAAALEATRAAIAALGGVVHAAGSANRPPAHGLRVQHARRKVTKPQRHFPWLVRT